ncbi:PREDICTED: protein takeout-like [Polistes dominula]|uniref:Protein takeout-like n=1 Tax=Polistes dominula TaxID=743375 RepID=A0ABM1HZD1_POLDO|nr:PREDICTED: protein takeout-like [Polistes dominula]
MKNSIILFLTLVYCISGNNVPQLPSFLKICHRNDPYLNRCIKESVEQLKPYLNTGIPELNIPPCEPLYIDRVDLNQTDGSIFINSYFTDIKIFNSFNSNIKQLKYDVEKNQLKIKQFVPHFEMLSNYNINGKIMMLPISGVGSASFNLTNVDYTLMIQFEPYHEPKTNQKHFRVKNSNIDYNIRNLQVHLDNLFNGDDMLEKAMNTFLNNNWKLIVDEVKPTLEETILNINNNIIDKIFTIYPIDTLLPP